MYYARRKPRASIFGLSKIMLTIDDINGNCRDVHAPRTNPRNNWIYATFSNPVETSRPVTREGAVTASPPVFRYFWHVTSRKPRSKIDRLLGRIISIRTLLNITQLFPLLCPICNFHKFFRSASLLSLSLSLSSRITRRPESTKCRVNHIRRASRSCSKHV